MKLSKDLKTIYFFAIVCAIISLFVYGVSDNCTDTGSYLTAWDNISSGHIDAFRTPIYPIYLGLVKSLFGKSYYGLAAVIGQYIVFFISINCFYTICSHFVKSSSIVFWITLFYSINPGFYSWSSCLLTESFALSGFVFLLYSLLSLYNGYNLKGCVITSLLIIFLLFLRPAFIYILPILSLTWITSLIIKKKKRQAIAGLTGIGFSSILLFLYISMINQEHGVFTISSVSIYNQIYISRQFGLINPNVINDSIFKSEIEESYRKIGKKFDTTIYGDSLLWVETSHYFDNYDLKEINEVLNKSFAFDPFNHILRIGNRTWYSAGDPLFCTYAELGIINKIIGAIGRFFLIYIFLLFYIVVLVKKSIHGNIPWESITFCLFALGNLFVIVVGAPSTWSRLFLPSYPIILIFVGQICTLINIKSINQLELL